MRRDFASMNKKFMKANECKWWMVVVGACEGKNPRPRPARLEVGSE